MADQPTSEREVETRSAQPGYEDASADSLNAPVQAHHPKPLPPDWLDRIPPDPTGDRGDAPQ